MVEGDVSAGAFLLSAVAPDQGSFTKWLNYGSFGSFNLSHRGFKLDGA